MDFINEELYKNDFGIYAIRNKLNNCTYVGQTGENFQRRYWHHRWKLKDNSHDNKYLQNAWNKYGEENFEFYVLEVTSDKSLLDEMEIKYIDKFKSQKSSYNMLLGGGGRRGFAMSEHAKHMVGMKNREHMLGTKHLQSTKEKMSETRRGKDYTRYRITNALNDDIVFEIKTRLVNGEKPSSIAKDMNIDYRHINNLISNNIWNNIVVDGWDDYYNNRKRSTRLSQEEQFELYTKYINGVDKDTLCVMYDRQRSSLNQIIRNQRRKLENKSHDNPVPSLV